MTAALPGMDPGYKVLHIFVDHTDFLNNLRSDKIIPQEPVVAVAGQEEAEEEAEEHEEKGHQGEEGEHGDEGEEGEHGEDTDSEFYDSDYDAEDGDDDIFEANVDKDVEDNNEKLEIVEQEDDDGLDNEEIQLSREQQLELKYKFKTFNVEVHSENPQFRVGMVS
jgi:hypothetical protein